VVEEKTVKVDSPKEDLLSVEDPGRTIREWKFLQFQVGNRRNIPLVL